MNENLNEQREVSQIKEKLAGEKFLNRFSNIKTWCKEQELFELNTPLFWLGLMLKIFAIVLFVPPMMEKFFVPFVEVFAQNVFSNPYEKFYLTGPIDAFPYSSIMLWLYAFPSALMAKIAPGVTESLPLMRFFWPRLTILLADFVILISLRALLPAHRRRMIGFWWLSPIAGYICYIHGQLDVLPTAALLVSLLLLFGNRQLSAYLVLGIGIAMKAHLLAALPFICIFSYLSLRSWWRVALLALISLCLYGLLQIPYMSDGFIQ
ncbi:MAG: hypothetical protein NTV34_05460, partial [Proteobacteria bacterium]|nr:hypothetical protein [Pseudomonadota bacterium]